MPVPHSHVKLYALTSATTSRSRCSTSLRAWAAGSSTSRTPADTRRESLTDVVMPLALSELCKVIYWLEDNQVEEGAMQIAGE